MKSKKARTALVFSISMLVVMLLTSAYRANDKSTPWVDDFIEYWAAGRLTIDGSNPYDPGRIMATERLVNPSMPVTVMMWNPPWTISLILPFSLMDYRTARTIWALLQMMLVMTSAGWLWYFYRGQTQTAYLAALAALLFPASLVALGNGQISPLVLWSLCAFLCLEERGRDLLAGVAASISLIKPHLVFLIWASILLWSVHQRRWRILLGASLAIAILMIAPAVLDPDIARQYVNAMREYPPDYYLSPTAGTLARLLMGWDKWWPQFLPTLVGAAWLVWYWWPRRYSWNWKNHLPAVLAASLLSSAFGWLFDQVIFLIPVIQLSTRLVGQRRTGLAKVAWKMLILACVLSIILWPSCIRLIQHPRNSQFADAAVTKALGQPNQFWQIILAPLFSLSFFLGSKCSPHIGGDHKPL